MLNYRRASAALATLALALVAAPAIGQVSYDLPSPPPSQGGDTTATTEVDKDGNVVTNIGLENPGTNVIQGTISLSGPSATRAFRVVAQFGTARYSIAAASKADIPVPLTPEALATVATSTGGTVRMQPAAATKNADGSTTTTKLAPVTAVATAKALFSSIKQALEADPSLARKIAKYNGSVLSAVLSANPSLKAAVLKANPGIAGALKPLIGSYKRVAGGKIKISGRAPLGRVVTLRVYLKKGSKASTYLRRVKASAKTGKFHLTKSVKGYKLLKVTAVAPKIKRVVLKG